MRTKSLFIAAAALAAGIASSSAQVYSQNVVGYINLTLNEGFNMISAQLDLDGTGTNNTVNTVFGTNVPIGTVVYTWNGSSWVSDVLSLKSGTWGAPNQALNPGMGAFVDIPTGAYGGSTGTVTITGNVLQGSLVNPNIPGPGYNVVSSMVPLSGGLQTSLGYTPQPGDGVYLYTNNTYNFYAFSLKSSTWTPSEPQITVGQGFWLDSATSAGWTNNFTVQ
jgi:hypothetical protein